MEESILSPFKCCHGKFIYASLWVVKKKKRKKKCLLQTEYCMAVIKQMTGEVDVTTPGSSRRPPVSLEYQRLSGRHFLVKSLLSCKRTGLVVHAKVASWLNEKLIDWLMLQRNISDMDMRVVTNVPNVWWHYVFTLVLDFIISTRIILLSINLGRDKIVITDYVAIYMHGVK